jgi:hypothetical protein
MPGVIGEVRLCLRPAKAGLRAGRSKVLQENHPYGPGLILADLLIFSHLLGDRGPEMDHPYSFAL